MMMTASIRLSILTAALLTSLLTIVLPSPQAVAAEGEQVGTVVAQRGVVLALRDGAPRALHIAAPVFAGDKIVTSSAARSQIRFEDGSLLSIGEATELVVSDYRLGADGQGLRGLLMLIKGIIRTSLNRTIWSGGFAVETRAAVASVRSTDWIVIDEPEGSAVFVVEGRVDVTSRAEGSRAILAGDDGIDVPRSGPMGSVKRWGAARVSDVLARTSVP